MAKSIWFWIAFNAFIVAMLALDLGLLGRRSHVIKFREAAVRSAAWFALSLCFAVGIYFYSGSEAALTFITGYLIEQSLSVDNIFVMVVIFSYFGVPAAYQHRVLFWGILGALVMRGTFIIVGAWLLSQFHFIIYIFGGLLVLTGIRMAVREEKPFDGEDNPVVKLVRRLVPLVPHYDGHKFFTIANGRRFATPLLLVLVLVEFTDLVFAIDSIPAIFAVTKDPFLVYTSNVFAILGLRSLYFLLAGVIDKFRFLRYGLAFILTFVGVKMLIADKVHIPTVTSLLVVAGGIIASVVASLLIPTDEENVEEPPTTDQFPPIEKLRRHG
ncbi:MAG TPA: TerC family protein [Longimicrobiales bacterium]